MAPLKKLWNALTTLIVIAIVILAILLAGVRLVGLTPYVVLSGSMEPNYHTGSLIYDKKVDPFTLKEGDVITFMVSEDTLATHRIVGVVPDEDEPGTIRFRTKGDANDSEDGTLVHYKNVVGTPVFTIPYLGYFSNWITHAPGKYIAITAAVVFLILLFLPDMLKKADEADQRAAERKREKERCPRFIPGPRPVWKIPRPRPPQTPRGVSL